MGCLPFPLSLGAPKKRLRSSQCFAHVGGWVSDLFSCVSLFFFYLAGTGVLLLFYHCNRNLDLEFVSSSILTRAGWLRYMLDKAVF